VLTPSTPFAYPQVVSRHFAYFRVVRFDVSAGQHDFCAGFDSRQLHWKHAGNSTKSLESDSAGRFCYERGAGWFTPTASTTGVARPPAL
jgi:hypothetical protein